MRLGGKAGGMTTAKELQQFKKLILRFVNTDGYDGKGMPIDVSQKKRGTSNGFHRDATHAKRRLLDMSASERGHLPYAGGNTQPAAEDGDGRGHLGSAMLVR